MLKHEKQIGEYESTISKLKEQGEESGLWSKEEIEKLENKLETLKSEVYSALSPWERVEICRHPNRPRSIDYIEHICDSFTEVFGDRLYRDDPAVVTGFGKIDGQKVVIIAQEKGNDTDSRLYRNFGMLHPEGYRKALRMMKVAEKFNLPVISLLDTPGAYPGLEAEERGQGSAIATNLFEMANLKTPIIALLIGEGCSGGALGMGVADVVGMLEHAYYSVISPEGCASILWRDSAKNEEAAKALKIHAEDLLKAEVIDDVIDEPQGGAHHDPSLIFKRVKEYILAQIDRLSTRSKEELVENRYQKFRAIGAFEHK